VNGLQVIGTIPAFMCQGGRGNAMPLDFGLKRSIGSAESPLPGHGAERYG
jgi:hypothetical protein